MLKVLINKFNSESSSISFNVFEAIFLNILPALDNANVTAFVSAASNTAPSCCGNDASTCQTLEVFFNLETISTPNSALIVSNDDPLYLVCQTIPILALDICFSNGVPFGIAYMIVLGWNVVYLVPSIFSEPKSALSNIKSPWITPSMPKFFK